MGRISLFLKQHISTPLSKEAGLHTFSSPDAKRAREQGRACRRFSVQRAKVGEAIPVLYVRNLPAMDPLLTRQL